MLAVLLASLVVVQHEMHAAPASTPGWHVAWHGTAFVQYALDSRALSTSGLFPSRLGRWNGIAYYVIAAIPIVRDAFALGWPGQALLAALAWALIASTIVSMLDRLRLLAAKRRAS